MNALLSNPLFGCVLPQVIDLYTKLTSSPDSRSTKLKAWSLAENWGSGMLWCLSICNWQEKSCRIHCSNNSKGLDYHNVSEEPIRALLLCVNKLSLEYSKSLESLTINQQSLKDSKLISNKGKGSLTGAHGGACVGSIQQIAQMLLIHELSGPTLAQALILLHEGTSHCMERAPAQDTRKINH
jgi:hypothetical protein